MLIPPIIIGVVTVGGLIFMHFVPPPNIAAICLKAHNVDTFNLYPHIQLFVNDKQYYLPDTVGKEPKDNKPCLRVIHTDSIGDTLHIEFVRPIKLSMNDFLKVYSFNNKTIDAIDNSTGHYENKTFTLNNYKTEYSYYTDKGIFTKINNITNIPPFSNSFLGRINLTSK